MRKKLFALVVILIAVSGNPVTATPVPVPGSMPVPAPVDGVATRPSAHRSVSPTDSFAPAHSLSIDSGEGVAMEYEPVVSLANVVEGKTWKTTERYQFADIGGAKAGYDAGEEVELLVNGTSSFIDVNEDNGFSVTATLFEVSMNNGNRAQVSYDYSSQSWRVKLKAPKDPSKEYKIVLNMFCKTKNSKCAALYGFESQIDKIIPVQVLAVEL